MSKEKKVDTLEITFPSYFIFVPVILIVGLIAFFLFSNSSDEDAEEVTLSDPSIVEASTSVVFENGTYIGDPETAKYAIVEFSDYRCPFCEMHTSMTYPEIERLDLGDELIYIFKEMTIMSEAESMMLSLLGKCIHEYEGIDNYLDYRKKAYDIYFETEEELFQNADVRSDDIKSCFDDLRYKDYIENNLSLADAAGVQGVPGFVVGKLSDANVVEGYLIPGAYPYENFKEVLDVLKN